MHRLSIATLIRVTFKVKSSDVEVTVLHITQVQDAPTDKRTVVPSLKKLRVNPVPLT